MVRGLPSIKGTSNTYDCDILGNKNHESFPKGVSYREKHPLELVHTDYVDL